MRALPRERYQRLTVVLTVLEVEAPPSGCRRAVGRGRLACCYLGLVRLIFFLVRILPALVLAANQKIVFSLI